MLALPVIGALVLTALAGGGPGVVGRALATEGSIQALVPPAAGVAPAAVPAPEPPPAPPAPPPAPGVPSTMAALVGASDVVQVDGQKLDAVLLRELYAPRAFTPQWLEPGSSDRVRAVVEVLGRAHLEGLDPRHYHVSAIERRLAAQTEIERAEVELLLSDAVMRYAGHVRDGAYRPNRATKHMELRPLEDDPTRFAIEAAAVPDVRAYLGSLPPRRPSYSRLKEALAHYRELEVGGGWPGVPDGPKLTPGIVDPAVRAVRARLAATGEIEGASKKPNVYDPALVKAVKAFQARHGLGADGVVGPKTREALNAPASQRVAELEIALERERWTPEDLGERYVWINVPDQRLELRDRGGVELEMRVIVGKSSWSTPEFSAEMTDVVFNPSWFVPPKIAREELIPKARADDSYFARQGIQIRGGVKMASARGEVVADDAAPTPADVTVYGPIRLRQMPGPQNPLGRIKFNMPNGFGVYLHDTPNKTRFRLHDRRLSHGCVRVGDAEALAAAVLGDTPRWDDARREAALASWQTKTAQLDTPLPVHLVYRTAWVDESGEVQFREDVYDRDAELLARWDKPRSVRRPPPPPPPAPAVAPPEIDGAAQLAPESSAPGAPAGGAPGAGAEEAAP